METTTYHTTQSAKHAIRDAPPKSKFVFSFAMDAHHDATGIIRVQRGLTHYLDISRAQAAKLVSKMLSSDAEEAGGRIKITVTTIPARVYNTAAITYWIGI